MQGKFPLDERCLEELCDEMEIPMWTGAIGFYGTEKQIAANMQCARERLSEIEPDLFIVNESFKPGGGVVERFAQALCRGMTGNVEHVTQRPRWRMKSPAMHSDWSEDRCGIIWFPVTAPNRGHDVNEAVRVVRETVWNFGFEPDMSVSAIRERTVELNCSIVFDRDDPEQERGAIPCAREVLVKLAQLGFYPHRLGIPTMEAHNLCSQSNRDLLAKIKLAVDPQGLFANGRYFRANLP